MEARALAAESRVDRSLTKDDAVKNAITAAELYMEAVKHAANDRERTRLRSRCERLLTRAEEIKKAAVWTPSKVQVDLLKAPVSERLLTRSEQVILLEGSKLHGFIFPPWTSDPEPSVFNSSPDLYTDPVDLKLSDAQKEIFAGWQRPAETSGSEVVGEVDCDASSMTAVREIDLVQDITTDCSVVASLCAGVARVHRGHEKLLNSMIYPYDKARNRTCVSKNGKYIFRFHFNGCFRKVTIDDRLPSSNSSRSLHVVDRNNPQLIWPALVEKAYLKVRGGYDFPGSNSGTDLWVLTGWIPEQVFLQSDDLHPEKVWNRVLKALEYGDVMITLGTGKLSSKEESELGLAGAHDYAVLDMRERGSQRELLVKNPWCDGMAWKGLGADSNGDADLPWTRELIEALPQKPMNPGTSWVDFEDVVQHFESLYLNWNPGLFRYRYDHHFSWTLPPIKNTDSFIYNPQYAVRSETKDTVWILLSRHFATAEHDMIKSKPLAEASSALGFISLYIFDADGHRVYLGDDAIHRGAFVDSPQTLACLDMLPSITYTIAAAQHDLPLPRYSFTLSLFSRSPLTTFPATDPLPHSSTLHGAWTPRSAGGNAQDPSYPSNPHFSISVPSPTPLTLLLETPAPDLALHITLLWTRGLPATTITTRDIVADSGDYRRGTALASIPSVAAGRYTIVVSTFAAGQTGSFTLRVAAAVPCTVTRVAGGEAAGRLRLSLPQIWFSPGETRMLAPLTTPRLARVRVIARGTGRPRPLLRVGVERGQGPNKTVLDVSGGGGFEDGTRTGEVDVRPGMGDLWVVVERMGVGEGEGVDVEVLSDGVVQVGPWGTGDG